MGHSSRVTGWPTRIIRHPRDEVGARAAARADDMAARLAGLTPHSRDAFAALQACGPTSAKALAKKLGRHPVAVRVTLNSLLRAGLAVRVGETRTARTKNKVTLWAAFQAAD